MPLSEQHLVWVDDFDGDSKSRNMLESHSHPFYELSLVMTGDITVLFDDKKYTSLGNCVILSPAYKNHHIIVAPGRYCRHNLYFYPFELDAISGYENKLNAAFGSGGSVAFLSSEMTERLAGIIRLISDEKTDEGKSFLLLNIINTILNETKEYDGQGSQSESYIDDVLRVILNEFSSKLVAADLAERFFVSRTKLMTDFKQKTGKTLLEYITFVRVERAKHQLKRGKTISDTALACGFVNAENFARVFKKGMGLTPKQYQQSKAR